MDKKECYELEHDISQDYWFSILTFNKMTIQEWYRDKRKWIEKMYQDKDITIDESYRLMNCLSDIVAYNLAIDNLDKEKVNKLPKKLKVSFRPILYMDIQSNLNKEYNKLLLKSPSTISTWVYSKIDWLEKQHINEIINKKELDILSKYLVNRELERITGGY